MSKGRTYAATPFREILPSSIRDAPEFAAASVVLDRLFAEIDEATRTLSIWGQIDELEEPILTHLAWSRHMDGYEGYELAKTLDQKREFVRNAILLHFHKGTPYAVERAIEILGIGVRVVEWFELTPEGQPYTFRLELTPSDEGIDQELWTGVMRTVKDNKNLRSHLVGATIFLNRKTEVPYLPAALISGARVTVYPATIRKQETSGPLPIGGGLHTATILTVYPL